METPAKTLDRLSKIVVGFLNGDRIKGYVCEFSASEDSFNLLPQDDPLHRPGIKVGLRDLKAVFFVWEFSGIREYHDFLLADAPKDRRTIEVTSPMERRLSEDQSDITRIESVFSCFPLIPRAITFAFS